PAASASAIPSPAPPESAATTANKTLNGVVPGISATPNPAPIAPAPLQTRPVVSVAVNSTSTTPPPATVKPAKLTNVGPIQPNEYASTAVMLPGRPPRRLVNADIVVLKQAGFGDDVIISKIRASGANYKLEIKDLLELKKANISDLVISAMIEASN